ncbi:MAG: hypothetical protein ACRDVP_03035 [Acidimicrobiales bacterium]
MAEPGEAARLAAGALLGGPALVAELGGTPSRLTVGRSIEACWAESSRLTVDRWSRLRRRAIDRGVLGDRSRLTVGRSIEACWAIGRGELGESSRLAIARLGGVFKAHRRAIGRPPTRSRPETVHNSPWRATHREGGKTSQYDRHPHPPPDDGPVEIRGLEVA